MTPAVVGGYTGHEHLDEVGLVHMNGRIYDPASGRFLQAAPIVQSPGNSQSYNRYSYVMNNPLGLTDPSGYAWWNSIWTRRLIRRPPRSCRARATVRATTATAT